MRQDWEPEDLIEVRTLLEDDMKRLRNKSGANRLGFAMLLKFFEVEARFPEAGREVPAAAVGYVAHAGEGAGGAVGGVRRQGDRIKRHRKEIRKAFGFRAGTEEDQERLAEAVVARCRNDFVEPPAPAKVRRLVGKASVGRRSAASAAVRSARERRPPSSGLRCSLPGRFGSSCRGLRAREGHGLS
ncbi:DUF4158 domain-containing protein [Streptomyces sp. NBC_00009]|uniref:DUF4158 domain-containing protein n=1 Tax=Streptomyces sp. NBC_00009 TaxID=2975620 RepID=UPI0032476204